MNTELFVNMVNRMSDGFIALDQEWSFVFVNKTAAHLFDRTNSEELVGKNIWSAIPIFTDGKLYKSCYQAVKDQKEAVVEEFYAPWQRWVKCQLFPTKAGLEIYLNEFNKTETRYKEIVENQTDLVCRYMKGGILTYVNKAYCEHYDMSAEDLIGSNLYDLTLLNEHEKLQQHIASINYSNPIRSLEIQDRDSKGVLKWFHWTDRILLNAQGEIVEYQGEGRDISQIKDVEDQLRQMLDHTLHLADFRSRYISMAAHDLRGPLTVISTGLDFVQYYRDKLSKEDIESKFDAMRNSLSTMVNMLDDIMKIGLAESGELKFSPSSIDVDDYCVNLIEEIQQIYQTPNSINYSVSGACEKGYLDAKLVRNILINLLSNAIKYSINESAVSFSVSCDQDQVVFNIKDAGIGIPKDDQYQLFEAFHRASNVHDISGSGLGLAIVKQAVDLHGGTIDFESEENRGTTFTIKLPQ